MPLADNDIKCELSFAYLDAIASRAGCECRSTGRHSDNQGIDAEVLCYGDFGAGTLRRVTILFQLKATSQPLSQQGRTVGFDLEAGQYNRLRELTAASPVLLLVLQLPADPNEWLKCSAQALSLKKCAYWMSLRGLPHSGNKVSQRVHLPRRNRFSVETLRDLVVRAAHQEDIFHDS